MRFESLSMYMACALCVCAVAFADSRDVVTQHNDNMRTGHYAAETLLTPALVKSGKFNRLPDLLLQDCDDQIYAQPLYLHGLAVPRKGVLNVLFVATQQNKVYAFDADNGGAPLWVISLGTPAPVDELNPDGFDVIYPIVGITSTPVIDRARGRLYVVSMSKDVTGPGRIYQHTLYSIDIASGAISSRRVIQGSATGNGDGSNNGTLSFDAVKHRSRAGLLLQNNTVYVAFGGAFEKFPYHGWVFSFNADTLAPVGTYAANVNGTGGGIWQSGNGLAGDGSAVYASTGNGVNQDTDSFTSQDPRGSSVVKFAANLAPMDWFTPFNQQCLDTCDLDLATGGPVLIPGLQRLIAGGKEGRLYVLDSTSLGHGPVANDTQIRQSFKATEDQYSPATARRRCENFTCNGDTWHAEVGKYPHMHGSPVVWTQTPGSRYRIYVQGEKDRLKAFQYDQQAFRDGASNPLKVFPAPERGAPIDQSSEIAPEDTMPGGILALSSNGQQAGSVILWVSIPKGGDGASTPGGKGWDAEDGHNLVTGVLRAYDAADLKTKLWEQELGPSRYVKFVAPTIAEGKVYLAGIGRVAVFGTSSRRGSFGDAFVSVFHDQQHFVYRDNAGSIRDSFYVRSDKWHCQEINTDGHPASGNLFVSVFDSADQQHFVYTDASGNIWDSYYARGQDNPWRYQQIGTSGHTPVGGIFVSSFFDQQHFVFRDGAGSIWDSFYSQHDSDWHFQQINTGGHPAAGNLFVSVFDNANQQHFVYTDSLGNIWDEYFARNDETWHFQQIATHGHTPVGGIFVSAFFDQQHFVFRDGAGLIWDSFYSQHDSDWHFQQINTNGHPAAGNLFVSVFDAANQQHFVYTDSVGNIWDEYFARNDDTWHFQQIATHAHTPVGGIFVSAFFDQQHFVFRDSAGFIWDSFYSQFDSLWHFQVING